MAIISTNSSNFEQPVITGAFTLEANAHMFQMLSKNVYNNIILAGIRELSTNAVDACILANLPVKFDVHVPEVDSPTFSVRDYGIGLSEEELLNFYTVMGASNKRESNAFNGQFG